MKKYLLFLMTLWAINASAQDVIVKKDGETIVSKVLEITSTEVKYKKFTNQNGPTYTILKTEVQAINYENGEKETFGSMTSTQNQSTPPYSIISSANSLQQQNSDRDLLEMAGYSYSDELKKAKRLKIAGWTVGSASILTGAILILFGRDDATSISGIVLAGAGIATTTGCLVRAHKLKVQSYYSLNTIPLYQYDFAFINGSSLSTGVDVLKDNRLHSQTFGLGLRYNF